MPGFLIPADLDRMLGLCLDMKPLPWAEFTLLASPGALVMRGTDFFRIPTLVPRTKENGECTFLLGTYCGIHSVAPFGCAYFDCGPERGDLSKKGLMAVRDAWRDRSSMYVKVWHHLFDKGLVQQAPEVLRKRMQ